MDYYNGYAPQERAQKLRAMHRLFPNHSHPCYVGPCQICGDRDCSVEPHTEDYSIPYLWVPPAEYAVCRTCHARLHRRFKAPFAWEAYKLHVKRGGYGSDLKKPPIAREIARLAKAIEEGAPFQLGSLRPISTSDDWWDRLTTDPASLTALWARPH